jgi:hypothetical protein
MANVDAKAIVESINLEYFRERSFGVAQSKTSKMTIIPNAAHNPFPIQIVEEACTVRVRDSNAKLARWIVTNDLNT